MVKTKKAIYINVNLIFKGSQLWKLKGKTLVNRKGLWTSDEDWIFKFLENQDELIYIENMSKTKVLGAANHSKVILQVKADPWMIDQLWKIGVHNKEGYFTLENGSTKKVLTAVSSTNLEISQGNITLR